MFRADSGEVKIADLGVSNEFDGADAFLTSTAGSILILRICLIVGVGVCVAFLQNSS